MIDRHAVHALLDAGNPPLEIAKQFGVSVRTIQRIAKEPRIESADDAAVRRQRGVGRPGVAGRIKERLRALIAEDPEAPPLEFLRVLREEGVRLGDSTFYRLFRLEQEKLPAEVMVRLVIGFDDKRPIWNATLAQVAIDYGFSIELCAARSPEQKGAVENLVGFVKRRFFRARRFGDLETDLPRQLLEWLTE